MPKRAFAKATPTRPGREPAAGARRLRLALALAAGLAAPAQPAAAQDAFQVIVNPANPGAQIKRESLQAIYLRPGARWPDGKQVEAVDQSARSGVRAAFSREALGLDVQAVQNQWMLAVASGRGLPPPVKGRDEDVIAFVRSRPAAIGYVSGTASLADAGVKLLKVLP